MYSNLLDYWLTYAYLYPFRFVKTPFKFIIAITNLCGANLPV